MSSQHYSSILSLLRLHNRVSTKRSDTLTAREQSVISKTLRQAKTMSSPTIMSITTPIQHMFEVQHDDIIVFITDTTLTSIRRPPLARYGRELSISWCGVAAGLLSRSSATLQPQLRHEYRRPHAKEYPSGLQPLTDLMCLSSQRHSVILSGLLRIWADNISGSTLFASYRGTRKIGSLKLSVCKTSTRAPIVQSLQRRLSIPMQGFLSVLYAVSTFTYKIP
jgi:hypothetical protein